MTFKRELCSNLKQKKTKIKKKTINEKKNKWSSLLRYMGNEETFKLLSVEIGSQSLWHLKSFRVAYFQIVKSLVVNFLDALLFNSLCL